MELQLRDHKYDVEKKSRTFCSITNYINKKTGQQWEICLSLAGGHVFRKKVYKKKNCFVKKAPKKMYSSVQKIVNTIFLFAFLRTYFSVEIRYILLKRAGHTNLHYLRINTHNLVLS